MEYKISIVVPVYNSEKYLKECMESIINQTIGFNNIQVILVNDGSTDNSKNIIEEFSEKYINIQTIHLEKSHLLGGFARNEGIKEAKGKCLMFLDSDDCLSKDACKFMYEMLVKNDADIVTANYKCMNEEGVLWEKAMFDKDKYKSSELKEADERFFYLYCPSACMKIFKTNLIKDNDIKFLNGVPAEDAYFSCKALLKSKKVWYLNEEIYYYRRRSTGNMSTSWMRNKKYFLGMNYAFKEIYELFKNENKIDYYRYYYAKNLISLLYKFIDSKLITNTERVELIDEMYWLYKQSKEFEIKFAQCSLNILLEYILEKKYDEIINTCEVISEMRAFMNEVQKEIMSKPQKITVSEENKE